MTGHPTQGLDDVVHQRVRLGVMTILTEVSRAEFKVVQDTLGVTAGNLSSHLRILENAGYVHIDKGYEVRRPRTWVSATQAGRHAFMREMTTLNEIVQAGAAQASRAAQQHPRTAPGTRLSAPLPEASA